MQFTTLLTAVLATAGVATANAIPELMGKRDHEANCKGSGLCKKVGKLSVLAEMSLTISATLASNPQLAAHQYAYRDRVICRAHSTKLFCAFWQGPKDVEKSAIAGSLEDALANINELIELDCQTCGSIPWSGDKDAEFTVNAVNPHDFFGDNDKCVVEDTAVLCPFTNLSGVVNAPTIPEA